MGAFCGENAEEKYGRNVSKTANLHQKCRFLCVYLGKICIYQKKSVTLQRKVEKVINFMAREERNIIGYTVALVSEFANHFGVEPRQAYAYMKRYKGMEHLQQHYGILHTQSFPDTVEILAQVCAHNGGGLK